MAYPTIGTGAMIIALAFAGCAAPGVATGPKPAVDRPPQAFDVIRAGLSYPHNPVVRAQSVEALEIVASRDVLPWVRSALLDEHPGVRFAACMVAGKRKDAGALSMIRKTVADPDDSVKAAAVYALHQLGDSSYTHKLPALVLNHPDPAIRRNAVIALSLLGKKSAVTVLARAMKDSDLGVRQHALEGMARLGNKEAARELTFMANSGIGSEEVFAINALAATRDPAYEDVFRFKLANGAHMETRLAAARALGALRIDAGTPVVMEALKGKPQARPDPDDPPVEQSLRWRQLAAAAAGAIGRPEFLEPLDTLLRDGGDPRVQIAAARAILEITEKRTAVAPFAAVPAG